MKNLPITPLLSYVVAFVTFSFGLGIIIGIFRFEHVPSHLRTMFSIVLILWGVYRALSTYTRDKQRERDKT